jgi:hypothetical protein
MSNTPRTDAEHNRILVQGSSGFDWGIVPVDFARQLERELAEARRALVWAVESSPPGFVWPAWTDRAALAAKNAEPVAARAAKGEQP